MLTKIEERHLQAIAQSFIDQYQNEQKINADETVIKLAAIYASEAAHEYLKSLMNALLLTQNVLSNKQFKQWRQLSDQSTGVVHKALEKAQMLRDFYCVQQKIGKFRQELNFQDQNISELSEHFFTISSSLLKLKSGENADLAEATKLKDDVQTNATGYATAKAQEQKSIDGTLAIVALALSVACFVVAATVVTLAMTVFALPAALTISLAVFSGLVGVAALTMAAHSGMGYIAHKSEVKETKQKMTDSVIKQVEYNQGFFNRFSKPSSDGDTPAPKDDRRLAP